MKHGNNNMRIFLSILVLIFSLQTWTKADDISEFEIEGMSIGDSLLDLVTKSDIEKKKDFKHPNKKYFQYIYLNKKNTNYDYFQFAIMDKDKNYIIEGVTGGMYFHNNIRGCLKKMDEVIEDVSKTFSDLEQTKKNVRKHRADPSEKTIITEIYFNFSTGDVIAIQCTDYSETLNYYDQLSIKLVSSKYFDWMTDEAYE